MYVPFVGTYGRSRRVFRIVLGGTVHLRLEVTSSSIRSSIINCTIFRFAFSPSSFAGTMNVPASLVNRILLPALLAALSALSLANASAALYGDSGDYAPSTPATDSINLWPGPAPGEHAGAIGPEYAMCFTDRTPVSKCKDLGVGNVTVPTITPYLAPHADSAMIIAPGGGYNVLATVNEGVDIATWLNSIGVSAFVLKYRVPGRSWLPFGGAPLMDAQRAMGMVREMASSGKLAGLNESKVGFMGFSAGGHLAGHINVAWHHRTYAPVDNADAKPCRRV